MERDGSSRWRRKRERMREGSSVDPSDGMVGRISWRKRAGGESLVGTKVEERRPALSMAGGGRRTRVSSTTQLAPAVPDSHLRLFLPASRTLRTQRRMRRRIQGEGSAWVTRGGTRNYSRGRDYPSERG